MANSRFSASDSQPNRALPPSDDELRVTMAALATATAHPALPSAEFMALVEQKRHEMILPDAHEIACVFFSCGNQRWGVRLSDVFRIVPQLTTQPVAIPNSPPWVAGVFRIEADFATLIDTARFLGEPPSLPQRRQRDQAIIVIAQDDALLGLFVTQLSLATTIQDTEWQPSDRSPSPPVDEKGSYLLATYTPIGQPCAGSDAAQGFLDVTRIATECLATLEGEDADDD